MKSCFHADISQKQPSRGAPRKSCLKICSKFAGEHPCRSVISIKLQSKAISLRKFFLLICFVNFTITSSLKIYKSILMYVAIILSNICGLVCRQSNRNSQIDLGKYINFLFLVVMTYFDVRCFHEKLWGASFLIRYIFR